MSRGGIKPPKPACRHLPLVRSQPPVIAPNKAAKIKGGKSVPGLAWPQALPGVEDLEDAVEHAYRVCRAAPGHALHALYLRGLGEGVSEHLVVFVLRREEESRGEQPVAGSAERRDNRASVRRGGGERERCTRFRTAGQKLSLTTNRVSNTRHDDEGGR